MKKICLYIIGYCLFLGNGYSQTPGWEWQTCTPQYNSVGTAFAFDSTTIMAAGGVGTIVKTSDAGKTWQVKYYSGGTSRYIVNIKFVSKQIGWFATDWNSIYKTTDGGMAWVLQHGEQEHALGMGLFFIDDKYGYAVAGNGLILKTTDGGTNWIDISLSIPYWFFSCHFFSKDTGIVVGGPNWAGGGNGVVLRTTNGGASWDTTLAVPSKMFVWVKFVDKNYGWAGATENNLFKTTDGGKTWKKQNPGAHPSLTLWYGDFLDSLSGWVLAGGSVHFTTDGGSTWAETYLDRSIYSVHFVSKRIGWITGHNGVIFRSADGGKTWTLLAPKKEVATNFAYLDIDMVDKNSGWVVGGGFTGIGNNRYGVVSYTTNGGINWNKQKEFPRDGIRCVAAVSTKKLWVAGDSTMASSTDGGVTWKEQIFPISYFTKLRFVDSLHGFAHSYSGNLYLTSNGGLTWVTRPYQNIAAASMDFVNPNLGWFVDWNGNIFHTVNAGQSWVKQTSGVTLPLSDITFADRNNGWVVGDSGLILYTSNGGNIWEQQKSSMASWSFRKVKFIDTLYGWITRMGDNTFYSDVHFDTMLITTTGGKMSPAGGRGWMPNLTGLWSGAYGIDFVDAQTGWLTTGAAILKTTNGGVTPVTEKYPEMLHGLSLSRNFPNPFSRTTTIRYNVAQKAHVRLVIYNAVGEEVADLVDGEQSAGEYNMQVNADSWKSGVYYYTLSIGSESHTGKMIVVW